MNVWRSRTSTRLVTTAVVAALGIVQPVTAVASMVQEPQEGQLIAVRVSCPQPVSGAATANGLSGPTQELKRSLDGSGPSRWLATSAPFGPPADSTAPIVASVQRVAPDQSGRPKVHSRSYYLTWGLVGSAVAGVGGYLWYSALNQLPYGETADAFKLTGGIFMLSFGSTGAVWGFWKAAKTRSSPDAVQGTDAQPAR